MALRDAAIVGYAETKIVEKSGRDLWELGAEILETLLGKTKFEKGEIDGLILSSSMTGAGNCFLNGARFPARARSFPTRSPVARVPPSRATSRF
jgi:acetyl-CoA acetyltransferase